VNSASAADRLRALGRADKWYLSCGDGIIWAPSFPRWLHLPGFWDEALVHYHPFAPLFTIALVGQDGNELRLSPTDRKWYPHKLTVDWQAECGVDFAEERYALPGGRLTSLWRAVDGHVFSENRKLDSLHLVAYTAQPGEDITTLEGLAHGNGISWRRTLSDQRKVPLDVTATLTARPEDFTGELRIAALRSEGQQNPPAWMHTPFWEHWARGRDGCLTNEVRLEGISNSGLIYAAVEVPLNHVAGSAVEFSIELVPVLDETAERRNGETAKRHSDPVVHWESFFDSFPRFACSDPHLTRYYDYRLYGLALNRLSGDCGNVHHPAIAEGIGYFHVPITYSAQCHMWETRWSRSPAIAHGSLLNFLEHQRDDGSLHGRLYTNHLQGTDFYHANWGDAVLAVDAVHPETGFLKRAYDGLCRYARWLDDTRDPEQSGMYDVVNHYETGQEYMSRYQFVSPNADVDGWDPKLRLKGIDVTVYTYQLKRSLQQMAAQLGRSADAESWARGADRIGAAILGTMWDADAQSFSDVEPATKHRTGAKSAVCFYPLLTDLLDDTAVNALADRLRDPREFGTEYPVPSSSVTDPYFNPCAEWRGKRHNCPWNGRTWPMTNSHVIEGLLRQWHGGRRDVGELAAHILVRFVRMMFFGGDVARPNCFEHYNPFTGHPSVYRGIDDYQHSWVLDLLIRGVAGLEPRPNGILVDPLPMAVNHVGLRDACVCGHEIQIQREGEDVTVTVDGTAYTTELGHPLEINYE
jgi:hypothetical protein